MRTLSEFPRWSALPVLLILILAPLALLTPAARAETIESPATLTITGESGSAEVRVDIPPGAVPRSLTGDLTSTFRTSGSLVVTAGARVIGEHPASTNDSVSMDLTPADVDGDSISLGLSVQLDDQSACFAEPDATATLSGITLTLDAPTMPLEAPADYLTGSPRSVTVVIPTDPSAAQVEAGLTAVTVMAHRFSRPTDVSLGSTAPIGGRADLDRVVRIRESEGATATISVIDGELVIEAPAAELTPTVASLDSPFAELLGATGREPTASGPTDREREGTVPLSAVIDRDVVMSGSGRVEQTIDLSQPNLGGPVSELTLDLVGSVTPSAGGSGRVDVLWNEQMVASQAMSDSDQFRTEVTLPARTLQRDNRLTFRMDYVPASGRCSRNGLPAAFDLDTDASRVTVTPGDSTEGFAMFPTVWSDGAVAVANAGGVDVARGAAQAAEILASLQRLTPTPLLPRLTSVADLASGDQTGLAVGVDADTDQILGTPLRLEAFRTVDSAGESFSVGVDQSFAALEGYRGEQGQPLLVLGGYGPQAAELADSLAAQSDADPLGWFGLDGAVLVAQPDREPLTLDMPELVPQEEVVEEANRQSLWWLWLIVGVVAVAIVARWLSLRRIESRARRDARSDARESRGPAADADHASPRSGRDDASSDGTARPGD